MPTYEVQVPDGRTFEVDGPRPPTRRDLQSMQVRGIFGASRRPAQEGQPSARSAYDPLAVAQFDLESQQAVIPTLDRMGTAWIKAGPSRVKTGLADAWGGVRDRSLDRAAGGARDVISGSLITALPMVAGPLLGAAVTAPAATATATGLGLAGYGAGSAVAERLGSAVGLPPQAAGLVGDVAGLGAGGVAARVGPGAVRAAARGLAQWRTTRTVTQALADLPTVLPETRSARVSRDDWARGLPRLAAVQQQSPITAATATTDLAAVATEASGRIDSAIEQVFQQFPTARIRVAPARVIAAATSASETAGFSAEALAAVTARWPQLSEPLSPAQLNTIRREMNAYVKGVLAKPGSVQYVERVTNPTFAGIEASARAIRQAAYGFLDARGVQGVRALRAEQGSILKIRDLAEQYSVRGAQVPRRGLAAHAAVRVAGAAGGAAGGALLGGPAGAAGGAVIGQELAGRYMPAKTRNDLLARLFARLPEAAEFMPMVPPQPSVLALPPGARQMPPGPDPSFVRGVPAEYGAKWEPPPVAPPPAAPTAIVPPPAPATPPRVPIERDPRLVRGKTATAVATVTTKKTKKPQTPAIAAAKVRAQVEKVIDLKDATSAADVQRRVVDTLTAEIEVARQANTFGAVEVRPDKAYGGRQFSVFVNGEPVIAVDRHGTMSAHYGVSDEMIQALGGKPVALGKTGDKAALGSVERASALTTRELHRAAQTAIARKLSDASGAGTISIHIPGDGTITIARNPVAIQEVLDRLKTGGSSPWRGIVAGERPLPRAQPTPVARAATPAEKARRLRAEAARDPTNADDYLALAAQLEREAARLVTGGSR